MVEIVTALEVVVVVVEVVVVVVGVVVVVVVSLPTSFVKYQINAPMVPRVMTSAMKARAWESFHLCFL